MNAYYNEHDPRAAQWLRNLISSGHIAPGDVDERSIEVVQPEDLLGYTQCHFFAGIGGWSYALRLAGWADDRPIWTGSCPCQPFSSAGKAKGFSDSRHLWPAWYRLIRECRPDVVVGEQVASPAGLRWFDLVAADMEGLDYAIGAVDLPAASVEAPILRQRLWFVAESPSERERRLLLQPRGPQPAEPDVERGGEVGLMAVAERGAPEFRRHAMASTTSDAQGEARQRQRLRDDLGDGGDTGHLGRARRARRQACGPHAEGENRWEPGRAPEPTDPIARPWRDADWIPCTDGTYRPVEPGTCPLVDGAPFRVGSGGPYENKSRAAMLKGYGNAIVPQVAAEFLRAYRATLDIPQGSRVESGVSALGGAFQP